MFPGMLIIDGSWSLVGRNSEEGKLRIPLLTEQQPAMLLITKFGVQLNASGRYRSHNDMLLTIVDARYKLGRSAGKIETIEIILPASFPTRRDTGKQRPPSFVPMH